MAKRVKAPRASPPPIDVLTPADLADLVAAVEGHRLAPVVFLAGHLGLRVGEVLGLQRQDVNLRNREVAVRRQLRDEKGALVYRVPKSVHGRRTLPLPSDTATLLQAHLDTHSPSKGDRSDDGPW